MSEQVLIESNDSKEFIDEFEKCKTSLPERIDASPNSADQGLAKLVLSIVELIRRLLEKQVMLRIDNDSLTDEEIENVGVTLMKLEEKMEELRIYFNLSPEDLELNLGQLEDMN